MRRVLVTGATTPLGRALVARLLAREDVASVVAVGRPNEPSPVAAGDPRCQYRQLDLRRSRNVRALIFGEAREVDAVVHSATHRSAHCTGEEVHALNVDTTRLLLRLVEERPAVKRFLYVSTGAVYRVGGQQPSIIDEEHPLNLSPDAPQWIRDRVEADLTVCTRMGLASTQILVLRFAECLAPHMGSQLYDFLEAPVCFRPLGFDPVINLISLEDMVTALEGALDARAEGVFNVPGFDTLSLQSCIERWDRLSLPAPGFLMAPLYRARAAVEKSEFRYDLNHWRFHYNGVLAGRRAASALGYTPKRGIDWPRGGRLPARP